MSIRLILDGIAAEWCRWTHGGGDIMRDPLGRINWQCRACGRWSKPVSAEEEAAATEANLRRWMSSCQCGAGTVADCVANTCAKVQAAARARNGGAE